MTADRPVAIEGCDMATGPDVTSVADVVDGKFINVRHLPRQDPLTKKSQVLLVLRAGGRIAAGHRPGLLQLPGAHPRSSEEPNEPPN